MVSLFIESYKLFTHAIHAYLVLTLGMIPLDFYQDLRYQKTGIMPFQAYLQYFMPASVTRTVSSFPGI